MKNLSILGGLLLLLGSYAGGSTDNNAIPGSDAAVARSATEASPDGSLPDLTHPPGDPEGLSLRNAPEWASPLTPAFQLAATTYQVPADLLVTLGRLGSGFENRGDVPTIEGGYGVMALRENKLTGDSLATATKILGLDRTVLIRDPAVNIVGAAAVLDQYADAAGVDRTAGVEAWLPVIERYAGLEEENNRFFARSVYASLQLGFDVANSRGERFTVQPRPLKDIRLDDLVPPGLMRVYPSGLAPGQAGQNAPGGFKQLHSAPPLRIASTPDYPGAIWDPAASCNYSTYVSSKDTLIVHTIEGTAAGCRSWFKNCDSQVSAQYVVSIDGGVWQMVEERHQAWHVSCYNNWSIGIEHEGHAADASHPQSLYDASAALAADICNRNGIPKVKNTVRPGILGHIDVTNCCCGTHTDPGAGWDWNYYIAKINNSDLRLFTNAIQNGGFESDFDSWSKGSSTVADILTTAPHRGAKYCKVHRPSAYATIWQNPIEITGQVWRGTCWAYRASGMTSTEFGFKNQSGVTTASVPVTASSWQFYSVDYTIADDVDVQIWGTGDQGIFIDDVRVGKASRMNWIADWVWNGTYPADMGTDHLASSGGEANAYPSPGKQQGGHTWTSLSQPDGFVDLNAAVGGTTNCMTYAAVYVIADAAKSGVNLVVGSDDGIKVFLNGVAVWTNDANRSQDYFNPDQDIISGLNLNPGENRLLIKVRQATGAYSLSARFCDDNGDAISGLSYRTTSLAQYMSDTIPSTLYARQPQSVSVTMKNTGTAAWTQAQGYKLGAIGDSDPFASARQALASSDSIAPSESKTFTFMMVAPATPGTYTTDWQMVQEGVQWFGEPLSKAVTVAPAVPGDMDFDNDVDQSDFGAFQNCMTGPLVAQTDPACAPAKLDGNSTVDSLDFEIFYDCMRGPDVAGDLNCAN